jgi:hypothetical protein
VAEEDNPVIGYHIADKAYQVLGPAGRQVLPALATEERARQAAKEYGRRDEMRGVVALHLAGLSLVWSWWGRRRVPVIFLRRESGCGVERSKRDISATGDQEAGATAVEAETA